MTTDQPQGENLANNVCLLGERRKERESGGGVGIEREREPPFL